MNPSTRFTTVSGRQVDLSCPKPENIDFDDIAEQLAKEARYNGATPGAIYFVAQHLVLGADWILVNSVVASPPGADLRHAFLWDLKMGGPVPYIEDVPWFFYASDAAKRIAAYYLCHDFPEAYLKDDTTPKKGALDRIAAEFGEAAGVISEKFAKQTERFDAAIHAAAGLPWPMKDVEAEVHSIDARMLVTEWKQLRPKHELPAAFAGVEPLPMLIQPWGWQFAHAMLADRMARLLPNCRAKG